MKINKCSKCGRTTARVIHVWDNYHVACDCRKFGAARSTSDGAISNWNEYNPDTPERTLEQDAIDAQRYAIKAIGEEWIPMDDRPSHKADVPDGCVIVIVSKPKLYGMVVKDWVDIETIKRTGDLDPFTHWRYILKPV